MWWLSDKGTAGSWSLPELITKAERRWSSVVRPDARYGKSLVFATPIIASTALSADWLAVRRGRRGVVQALEVAGVTEEIVARNLMRSWIFRPNVSICICTFEDHEM